MNTHLPCRLTTRVETPSDRFIRHIENADNPFGILLQFETVNSSTVWIGQIEVPEYSRGQGVGNAALDFLIKAADDFCVTLELQSIALDENNFDLDAWYIRHGFLPMRDMERQIDLLRYSPPPSLKSSDPKSTFKP